MPHRPVLELLKEALRQGKQPVPLGETLDFRIVEVAEGRAVLELDVTPRVHNSMGYLHGGAMAALADTCMGVATFTMLDEGETSTTTEFKINFVRPVFAGKVKGVGTVLKHGRTLTLVEAELFDAEDKLIAKALGTCMTLRGPETQNRVVKPQ